jgi:hypothetical protein
MFDEMFGRNAFDECLGVLAIDLGNQFFDD